MLAQLLKLEQAHLERIFVVVTIGGIVVVVLVLKVVELVVVQK
jgi:hypothetical protein